MATYPMTAQASSAAKFPAIRRGPAKTASPAGVPMKQQFHWTKPQTATFAVSNGMLSSNEAWQPNGTNFVRPDVDESADQQLANFVRSTVSPTNPERPQFRSALEQVSFETNNSLMEQYQTAPKAAQRGLLNMAARLLRK
jgi:hypothetical protein